MINAAIADRDHHISGGLTELVMTDFGGQQRGLILSMATQLSHSTDGRWLTWITSDRLLAQALRQCRDLAPDGLRLVYCAEEADQLWMTWDALSLGNSHTVIASPGRLSDRALGELESAAQRGNSQGILVRNRH